MARIPYVEKDAAPPEVVELYAKMENRGFRVANLWKMAANSPATLGHMIRLGDAILLKTKLNPKLREMAILRTAMLLDCEYERMAHATMGKNVGMTDEQIEAIKDWEKSKAFDKIEQAVLQFTDEVARSAKVTDETSSNLKQYLEPGMMVELAVTIGFYGMLARILVPFQVDLEEDSESLGQDLIDRPRVQKGN
jgi:alkylhydroperoxidase family enzyme